MKDLGTKKHLLAVKVYILYFFSENILFVIHTPVSTGILYHSYTSMYLNTFQCFEIHHISNRNICHNIKKRGRKNALFLEYRQLETLVNKALLEERVSWGMTIYNSADL